MRYMGAVLWSGIIKMKIKTAEQAKKMRQALAAWDDRPKWEPEGGEWRLMYTGVSMKAPSTDMGRLFGAEFPTKEAAVHGSNVYRTMHLLYQYLREHGATPEQLTPEIDYLDSFTATGLAIVFDVGTELAEQLERDIESGRVEL